MPYRKCAPRRAKVDLARSGCTENTSTDQFYAERNRAMIRFRHDPCLPPPSGKGVFHAGLNHLRTDCSSTRHEEGLYQMLAIGGCIDEVIRPHFPFEAPGPNLIA